jgi:hypothetical protein
MAPPTAGLTGTPPHQQRSSMKNINLHGDNCLFGDSSGNGIDAENARVRGSLRVDGSHSLANLTAWAQAVSTHGVRNPKPTEYSKEDADTSTSTRDASVLPESDKEGQSILSSSCDSKPASTTSATSAASMTTTTSMESRDRQTPRDRPRGAIINRERKRKPCKADK